ncbi:unnamed protein product [Gadus morhua 'NCC']
MRHQLYWYLLRMHQGRYHPPMLYQCERLLICSHKCRGTLHAAGHTCIGLCGDKCPTKCRICDHDEVTEIFFGSEDDPEAYFIQLEDCSHIVESKAMDTYMEMDQKSEDNKQMVIKLKECPDVALRSAGTFATALTSTAAWLR